jgi:formyl-CoA transferase
MDPVYETAAGRKAHEAAIDERLGQWTKTLTPRQVMRELQRAGVPAGMVATAEDMYVDPHLRARGFLITQEHPAPFGRLEHSGVTVHLSETPGTYRTPMPTMGQHNVEIYGGLLGMSAEEVKRLEGEKVLW